MTVKINVSVIVTHNGEILLMQRSLTDSYFPGAWGIPGGYMEKVDNRLEDTAVREVLEELGIEVTPTTVMDNNKNEETDSLNIVYLAELANKQDYPNGVKLSDEANVFKWAKRADIDHLEFTPYTKDGLEKVFDLIS